MVLKHGNLTKILNQNFLRRSARCSRLEKKNRNNVIREKMNIKNSILDYIRYKQMNWYGHVERIEEERLTPKILEEEEGEISGCRRLQQE